MPLRSHMNTARRCALLLAAPLMACATAATPAPPAKAPASDIAAAPIPSDKDVPSANESPLLTRGMPPPLPVQFDAGQVNRGDLLSLLGAGIPTFLGKVDVEAERAEGRFVGWRLRAYKVESWQGFVLQPGDLVMRVNRHSLERPEQLMQIWESLQTASEVTFEIIRGDQPSSVRFVIQDDSLKAERTASSQ